MAVLDFILSAACLLLWLTWRSRGLTSPEPAPRVALISTLKRAEPRSRDRGTAPAVLLLVLFVRAIIYWQVGSATHWTPQISLGAIVLHFRSDLFTRMLVFSLLSFLSFLTTFYFSLLLIVAVNRKLRAVDPWNSLVRAHLGICARPPSWLCLLLPFVVVFLLWIVIGPLLAVMKIHLPIRSFSQLCAQAAVIGLGGWLLWQYIIGAFLVLHLVSSYVYFGNAPLWKFVNATSGHLLRPMAWLPLRVGKMDLAPLLALGLLVLTILFAPTFLAWLYRGVNH